MPTPRRLVPNGIRQFQASGRVLLLFTYWCIVAIVADQTLKLAGPWWWNGTCLRDSPLKALAILLTFIGSLGWCWAYLLAMRCAVSRNTGKGLTIRAFDGMARFFVLLLGLVVTVVALNVFGCEPCQRQDVECVTYGPGGTRTRTDATWRSYLGNPDGASGGRFATSR